jgi:hypothetical protein
LGNVIAIVGGGKIWLAFKKELLFVPTGLFEGSEVWLRFSSL